MMLIFPTKPTAKVTVKNKKRKTQKSWQKHKKWTR